MATTSNFERTENHVSQSLKEHPDSTQAFNKELHSMQHSESAGQFKSDLSKMNDDLHKRGLLPGMQIVENEKTGDFEMKKMPDGKNQTPPESTPAPQNGDQPAPPEHQGHGGGGHGGGHGAGEHHGHHHGKHHKHHKHHGGGKGGDGGDKDNSSDTPDDGKDNGNGKGDAAPGPSNNDNDKGTPDRGKSGSADGSKVANDGSNMSKDEKEKYIFNRLTDNHEGGLHLTKAQAAGVIGNLESESKNLYSGYTDHKRPVEEHDLGFVNWTQDRKKGLESFAKSQGKSPTDFKTQVDYMVDELKTKEHGTRKEDALGDLRKTNNVAAAAQVFSNEFERPMARYAHNQDRVNNAQLAFAKMGSWGDQINDGVGSLGEPV